MPSSPLDCKHGRTTSSVACHHRLWAAHTVERRRAWHDITNLGLHACSDDVRRFMTSPPLDSTHYRQRRAWHDFTALGQHTQSDDVGLGTPSSPLGSTESQTTSGVACHHRPWTVYMVGRGRAWNAITSLGKHTRSDDIGRGMTSPPLDSTDSRTTLGVA